MKQYNNSIFTILQNMLTFMLFSFVTYFNRRAKEKRLKKDAGRARWGQYFRNGGSNGGTIGVNKDGSRASKIEDLKEDLIIGFSSGKLLFILYYNVLFQNIMRT